MVLTAHVADPGWLVPVRVPQLKTSEFYEELFSRRLSCYARGAFPIPELVGEQRTRGPPQHKTVL